MKSRFVALLALCAVTLTACTTTNVRLDKASTVKALPREDAIVEMDTLLQNVNVSTVKSPKLDIYMDEEADAIALADIDTFDITVKGSGAIDIEIATVSEFTGSAPDDWLNIVAKDFNKEKFEVNGKTASVTLRSMSAGEVVTYVSAGAYKPNVYIPSNDAWGKMLEASGVGITRLTYRIAGNTAGILMSKKAYESFHEKYKDDTVSNVLKAATVGDIMFAYTNPYTSSTGFNILTAMLKDFDNSDPLSAKASAALLEYQKTAPPVAYTTSVLRNQARKGIIDTMVMEEQAYTNTPELKDYKFLPFGIRHDHPVYTFGWNSEEENEVAKMFVDFCLNEKNQKLATEKGFNKNDSYKSQDSGLTDTGYLTAQSLWKQNKKSGKPIVAMFICDVSGSMAGEPLASLQSSLVAATPYISSEHYVGLMSYSEDVTINLPIEQFDSKQKAYFAGEVKDLIANGGTGTYDAVLSAVDMLNKKMEEIPDATPLIFVLTDGEATTGYSLDRIAPVIAGMQVPVYSIAYNYSDNGDLEVLSNINEAAVIKADTDDIVNQLRNLFNTQL